MSDGSMNRKEFLANAGKACVGACACGLLGSVANIGAQDTPPATPSETPPAKPRSEARMEFTEGWVKRFFTVLEENLDPETRKKIMMATGRACYLNWIAETKQEIKPVTLERFKAWITDKVKDGSYQIDGDAIYFQYMSAAETGQAAAEGTCLCPLVETKPAGLPAATYCICSVGYVKAMHEKYLDRPVNVELVDAVLMGGKRCRFKLTVA